MTLRSAEIVAQVEEWDCRHVVLTGGEPMIYSELIPLAEKLKRRGYHITIETAGTLYLPVACDLMSISPKLASSGPSPVDQPRWSRRHERERFRPNVIGALLSEYEYQLKFVVDRATDLEEVEEFIVQFPEVQDDRVLLMPQGVTQQDLQLRATWLKPFCSERGWVFCPRKQIEWYGSVRKT